MSDSLLREYWKQLQILLDFPRTDIAEQLEENHRREIKDHPNEEQWKDDFFHRLLTKFAESPYVGENAWLQLAPILAKRIGIAKGGNYDFFKPHQFIEWLQRRHGEGIDKEMEDEFVAQLLFLYVFNVVEPYKAIDLNLWLSLNDISNILLSRNLIETWKYMAWHVAIKRTQMDDLERLEEWWDTLEAGLLDPDEESLFQYQRKLEYFRINYSMDSKKRNKKALDEIDTFISKKQDSITEIKATLNDPLHPKNKNRCLVYIQLKHEKGVRLILLNRYSKALLVLKDAVENLKEIRKIVEEDIPGWREQLQAIKQNILLISNFFGEYHKYCLDLKKYIPKIKVGAFDLAKEKQDGAYRRILSGDYGLAENLLIRSYELFWGLRNFSGIYGNSLAWGQLFYQQALNTDDKDTVTELLLRAAEYASEAQNETLIKQARKKWEQFGKPFTDEQRMRIERKIIEEDAFNDIDKVGIAKFAQSFVDQLSQEGYIKAIKRFGEWSTDNWNSDNRLDVSGQSIKVLGTLIPLAIGTIDPKEALDDLVEILKLAVIKNSSSQMVIYEIGKIAKRFMELPKELKEYIAKPLIRIIEYYEYCPRSIHEYTWLNFTLPAAEVEVRKERSEEKFGKKLLDKIPPIKKSSRSKRKDVDISDYFNEEALRMRMILGKSINKKIFKEYFKAKRKLYLSTYLAEPPKLRWPGRFDNYIACILQLERNEIGQVLKDIIRIATRDKLGSSIQMEALESLSWYIESSLFPGGSEKNKLHKLKKICPDIADHLWKSIQNFSPDRADSEKEWIFDPDERLAANNRIIFLFKLMNWTKDEFKPKEIKDKEDFFNSLIKLNFYETNRGKATILEVWGCLFGTKKMKRKEEVKSEILALYLKNDTEINTSIYRGLGYGLSQAVKGYIPNEEIFTVIVNGAIKDAEEHRTELKKEAIRLLINTEIKIHEGAKHILSKRIKNSINDLANRDLLSNSFLKSVKME